MLVLLWGCSTILATWILAWHLGTHAAIGGSVVMTVAVLVVMAVYWILDRVQSR